MNESILNTIKKLLGIDENYTFFDQDLIIHINSAIFVLSDIGVKKALDYRITDDTAVWSDLIPEEKNLEPIKTFIYIRVRKIFDPPSSAVATALDETLKEMEWRIFNAYDTPSYNL